MANANPTNLVQLYTELNKFINISDYKQALKAANKIIHSKEGKEDVEAMHCKVVCMMQMNQFSEATKFIDATAEIKDVLVFEKAYCQYRLLHTEEALETISQVKDPDPRLLELKAQVLYKLGQYSEALIVYKNLIKECSDDYEEERMTNISAVHAALSSFDGVKTEMGFPIETYEQLYNKGCWLLGQDKVEEGRVTLVEAERVCREMFEDDPDVAEDEVDGEVSVIRVQLAYALQLQGKTDEALTIYNQVIRLRPTDIALVAVASNNIISINREQNVFDSRKKMKATVAPGLDNKLVPFQKKKINFNRALLFMYSNQWEACRKLLKSLHREHTDTNIPCLIQTAQIGREKGANKAVEYLKTYISEHSDPDLSPEVDLTDVKLCLVQLLMGSGNLSEACEVLESLGSLSYTPALVSCLVSLYGAQHEGEGKATKLMQRAIQWHKKNKSPPSIMTSLMWEASEYSLKHNDPKSAASVLEELLSLDPKNVKVLAKLIFAYSRFNPSKAHQASEDLPSLSDLSVHVDVDDLERNASRITPRYVKKQKEKDVVEVNVATSLVSEGTSNIEIIKTKKRKKKKNPKPQNFRENYTPDDERWLPLRERSYYKGRRKDRKKGGVGKGTQGGANTGVADVYDMSHKTSAAVAPNSPKPGSTGSGSHGNTPINSPKPTHVKGVKGKKSGGGGKKKKKGKGGW
uniref:signal recognition particle subunit SRP72-like n=1 Tax=Ciona intestinalis TaxID=7719 RepID=UPI000180B8B8|nr:signal recognition particle subunit SRP72-like [Ciona intestinalis]|eukprot:XP_002130413.1 signal recognition particle subunit SRP72-like [Ciona intestinalis]